MSGMMEVISKGGGLMWVIIGCSVVAIGVIVERLITLQRSGIDSTTLIQELGVVISNNNVEKAIEISERAGGPIGRICKAGLMRYDRSKDDIKETIEDAASFEVPFLEKNLGVLSTIAHISPLIGLLGTVSGMISVFKDIEARSAAGGFVGPDVMASGIWAALVTTAAGLSVAIPVYVAYNFLSSRVEGMVVEMEQSATDLVNIISSKKGF
jgi:biopolymer transport protein ExbB